MQLQMRIYQQFVKLFFVFAVLPFCAGDERLTSEIIHEKYEIQDNGSVLYDLRSEDTFYKYISIADIPLLDPSKDEKLDSFRLFEEGIFEILEVTKGTNFNYSE
ncbi:MAG: hypothetical protein EZS28_038839, partial [Streblomastix strix]